MDTLFVEMRVIDGSQAELRYWQPGRVIESEFLDLESIQPLLAQAEADFYSKRPDLVAMGQNLFNWLNGKGGWLTQSLERAAGGLAIALAVSEQWGNLPWELLHDGTSFLVGRVPSAVIVRWVKGAVGPLKPRDRGLNLLFMATSPEDVRPLLEFEQEEANILKITEELELSLRVEESGCVDELKKRWGRSKQNEFDVFHLTGHASLDAAGKPFFITETLTGERADTSPEDLLEAFGHKPPRLVFLSGCRTGESGNDGSVPSMAEALVQKGVPAVLGWGRSVIDASATQAAACLYERLAEGDSLTAALGATYRFLRQENIPDWHLLRLVVRSDGNNEAAWQALTEAPGFDYVPERNEVDRGFLDAKTQQVRVATGEAFVGRRRILQQSLRYLLSRNAVGLLLHGMGGNGKSTVGLRLLERLKGFKYEPVVLYRERLDDLTEQVLRGRLAPFQSERGQQILESKLPWRERLTRFLAEGLKGEQRLCFVLDDFEVNIEPQSDGTPVLKNQAKQPLKDLLQALQQCAKPHRLILTSRYDVALPDLEQKMLRVLMPALAGGELLKKYQRLPAFERNSTVAPELQAQAKAAAEGNPRLLEWLDGVLQDAETDKAVILERMQATTAEFREDILAAELLKQQSPELRMLLSRGLLFELAVPSTAMVALWEDGFGWEAHSRRAVALGLLEKSVAQGQDFYRVPRILEPLLPEPKEKKRLVEKGVKALWNCWQDSSLADEQMLMLNDLAQFAEAGEIALKVSNKLSLRREQQGRYREGIFFGENALGIAKSLLGEDHPSTATSYSNLAALYESQGRYEEAEPLYKKGLALRQRILGEDHPSTATSYNNLAALYESQGRYEEAEL
ncbi:CHAT domain containing protein, partial [Rubidibacter lacunae KORDI 51-2]